MQSDQANVERQDDCFPFVVSVGKYFLLLANRSLRGVVERSLKPTRLRLFVVG